MSLFKRGRRNEDVDPVAWASQESSAGASGEDGDYDDGPRGYADELPGEQPSDGDGPAGGAAAGFDRSHGPWDIDEVQDRDHLLDLGGLLLPGRDGMELRLEFEEATQRVTAATIALNGSAVQLQAFAAPRTEGIWPEIRAEIAASITRQGGTADEMPGTFGKELLARIPVRTPEGRSAHQPARFAGIDGPRWFLRAVFHGQAAFEEEAAAELEELVRGVVVVRGQDAMAPRELLVLRTPDAAQPEPEAEQDPQAREPLEPFRRGPEISEVR